VKGYARPATLEVLDTRFTYAFHGRAGYPPTIAAEQLPDRLTIGGIDVRVTDQPHGNIHAAGLRFEADNVAIGYATDFNIMTDQMASLYEGLDVWVVDALRRRPHPTHMELPAVLSWVDRLKPKRTALIHMDHSMDYASLREELPPGVEPGFDGLVLSA
jgi:phosphoribosyl 1,2-cyclic phosphate phosphodiesterase